MEECGEESVIWANLSDEELVIEAGTGNRTAFDILARRHVVRSLALARNIVGNPHDAEEVVQDAFIQVWLHADRWHHDGARFTTWLYRIVVNRAIDYRRRVPFAPLDDAGPVSDPAPGAEDLVAGAQMAREVERAIADLPNRQRAALSLCYYQGLTCAEASKVLEVSVSAMESLLVRARRMLRSRLRSRSLLNVGEEP